MQNLSYPIGKFDPFSELPTAETRANLIAEIAALPARMQAAVQDLTVEQLDTPYRPGGWTSRQVVHHVADSHANGYIRTKLALTEENPTIKPYEEQLWAELKDTFEVPIASSLIMLDVLHQRWISVWKSMTEEQFSRTYFHPASKENVPLYNQLGLYAWHSNHHLAHITKLRERMGW